jgi:hypothetical protein
MVAMDREGRSYSASERHTIELIDRAMRFRQNINHAIQWMLVRPMQQRESD